MKKVLLGLFALSSVAFANIHKDRIEVYSAVINSINNQMINIKVSFGEVRIGNVVRIYSLAGIKQIDTSYREFVITDDEYYRVLELLKIRNEMANKIIKEYQKWDGESNDEEVSDDFCPDCMSIVK